LRERNWSTTDRVREEMVADVVVFLLPKFRGLVLRLLGLVTLLGRAKYDDILIEDDGL